MTSEDPSSAGQVTELLRAWGRGDEDAQRALVPVVYDRLRRLARGQLRGERGDHTLQPTALVHAAYLQLVEMEVPWQDRGHFFALAARTMRRVLVDHARASRRKKRGEGAVRVTLGEEHAVAAGAGIEITALHQALERLEGFDRRKAQVIDLHYFAGLTYDEIARALAVSPVTVHRDLKLAKAWLFRELADGMGG